jgi:cobalt/nickel transport system permease protein
MFAVDELAYQSPMKGWPPLGKFLLALSMLIVSLISSALIVPMTVLVIGMAMLFYSTRFQFPRVIALALLEGMLVIAIGCMVIAFVTPGGETIAQFSVLGFDMTLSSDGLNLALLVFFRALAGITVMLAFATSTSIPHLALALRQLHMPKEIIELTILVYRYSFLLLEQLDTMYIAATSRLGFKGTRTKLRTSAKLAVGLFTRSIDIAERSQVALHCRNFKGDFPTYRQPARLTAAWLILPLAVGGALYAWGMFMGQLVVTGW